MISHHVRPVEQPKLTDVGDSGYGHIHTNNTVEKLRLKIYMVMTNPPQPPHELHIWHGIEVQLASDAKLQDALELQTLLMLHLDLEV